MKFRKPKTIKFIDCRETNQFGHECIFIPQLFKTRSYHDKIDTIAVLKAEKNPAAAKLNAVKELKRLYPDYKNRYEIWAHPGFELYFVEF